MAQDVKIFKVFVASPSDVLEERDAVESVVADLNANLCPPLGIRLEVLRWEKNVAPDFGDDPQDVVNKQIGEDYDIFVGILANRFGTPTQRAESGTAEEFEKAYVRFKANDPESVRLMVYFNEAAISPSELDLDQVAKVRAFKEKLGPMGGLYRTYTGPSSFKEMFRNHLMSIVAGLGEKKFTKPAPTADLVDVVDQAEGTNSITSPNSQPQFSLDDLAGLEALSLSDDLNHSSDQEGDFGVLDYLTIYINEFAIMNDALNELVELNNRFPVELQKRTDEMNQIASIKDDHGSAEVVGR